jgi:recombination protein RecR
MSDNDVCHICGDASRNASVLCVVEQAADMASIEKSGAYKGLYHTLGGALSPMEGVGPDDIRIRELMARIKKGDVREVILATGTNVEGEATAAYIASQLETLPIKVTRIASGVPMGGDLKYVDQMTLKRALESRHAL